MAKIYTRSGDDGETALLGGLRVKKDHLRIEAIGTADELNAALGIARIELSRSTSAPPKLDRELAEVQHRLFDLGAELAAPAANTTAASAINDADARELEQSIDRYENTLEPLRAFILPGGSPAAAQLHFARCVARRCERRIVQLASHEPIRPEVLRYINRLGDWLFVAARAANRAGSVPDVIWQQRATGEDRKP